MGRNRRTSTHATAAAAFAVALLGLAGCGSSPAPAPQVDLTDLSTPYGCGYGFQAGNDAGTVGIFLQPEPLASPPDAAAVDLGEGGAWSGEIRVGHDLFANWCSDVMVEGDPVPVVDETWELVDGVVEITALDEPAGTATMTATGLVAADPDGVHHRLGDVVLVNSLWGMFAG